MVNFLEPRRASHVLQFAQMKRTFREVCEIEYAGVSIRKRLLRDACTSTGMRKRRASEQRAGPEPSVAAVQQKPRRWGTGDKITGRPGRPMFSESFESGGIQLSSTLLLPLSSTPTVSSHGLLRPVVCTNTPHASLVNPDSCARGTVYLFRHHLDSNTALTPPNPFLGSARWAYPSPPVCPGRWQGPYTHTTVSYRGRSADLL